MTTARGGGLLMFACSLHHITLLDMSSSHYANTVLHTTQVICLPTLPSPTLFTLQVTRNTATKEWQRRQ